MTAAVSRVGSESPWRRRARRFTRNRAAVASLVLLVVLVTVCVAGSPWASSRYALSDLDAARRAPTSAAWLGTDLLGRSLLARCVLGGLVSLSVGVVGAAFSVMVGVSWGSIAGMAGGRVDALMMRFVDVLFGLPYLLMVILLKVGLDGVLRQQIGIGPGLSDLTVLLLAIGSVSWLSMARVIRGQVLSLRVQPFIEAARAVGVSTFGIWRAHVLPNLVGPIVVYATLTIPQVILQESFLSFLGIGIQPPLPSWGNLASDGVSAINNVESFWWLLVFPCGLLTLTLLALNFVGDGLRDALDPRGGVQS